MTKSILWTREFRTQVKRLSRKYRRIFDDIDKLTDDLETGRLYAARQLQGVGGAPVFRVRRANSSDSSGKSGGFRIFFFRVHEVYLSG